MVLRMHHRGVNHAVSLILGTFSKKHGATIELGARSEKVGYLIPD